MDTSEASIEQPEESSSYTPKFKDEALRQVAEKGHSAQEVAARLGVSSVWTYHDTHRYFIAYCSSAFH